MRTTIIATCWVLAIIAVGADRAGAIEPKVVDRLQPVRLTRPELSGEIGRRIEDLIYKNYMVLDLEHGFLDPFRQRPPCKGSRYIGVGKVIDAASMFAAYTGDPEVAKRTTRLIDELMKTRDADGYPGTHEGGARGPAELPQLDSARPGVCDAGPGRQLAILRQRQVAPVCPRAGRLHPRHVSQESQAGQRLHGRIARVHADALRLHGAIRAIWNSQPLRAMAIPTARSSAVAFAIGRRIRSSTARQPTCTSMWRVATVKPCSTALSLRKSC